MNNKETVNKYQNTKIYRLEHIPTGYFYIGSTTQHFLCNRLSGHRQHAKNRPSPAHLKFNELGWDGVKIVLIQQVKCENKEEQYKEENVFISKHRADPLCLNSQMAYRERGEYYAENRDFLLVKNKERYEGNKEEINKQNNIYYHEHKEANKPKRKQYNIDHREHKADYDREYREKNKDKIKKNESEIFTCGCGGTYNNKHKTRHELTKKHQAWMALQQQN